MATKLFILICCVCFCLHTGQISKYYFGYETSTVISIEFPRYVQIPATTTCFLNQHVATTSFEHLTLNELFKRAPPTIEVLDACRYRTPGYDGVREYSVSKCSELFEIKRFYTAEFMCYDFNPTSDEVYDFYRTRSSYASQGIIYELVFNMSHVRRADYFKTVIHVRNELSPLSLLAGAKSRRHDHNQFAFSYQLIQNHRLPTPYTTHCVADRMICLHDCFVPRVIDTIGRAPFSTILLEGDNRYNGMHQQFMTRVHWKNVTMMMAMGKIEQQCDRMCPYLSCHESITVTNGMYKGSEGKQLYFMIELPRSPTISVTFIPAMNLIDYLTLVLSCFGTWLGLSAISFDPSRVFECRRNRRSITADQETRPTRLSTLERALLGDIVDLRKLVVDHGKTILDLQRIAIDNNRTIFDLRHRIGRMEDTT